MKGIVLAGDSGNKLLPLTKGIPKQLIPIYDKPMIYYPIETLVEAGIKDILIIVSPQYMVSFQNALGTGDEFGATFTYMSQSSPEGLAQALTIGETFFANEPVCMITGDCIIFGKTRATKISKAIRAAQRSGQATIFVCRDSDPNQYGVVTTDEDGKCEEIFGKYDNQNYLSIVGLYVFPRGVSNYARLLKKSERGLFEITSLNKIYLEEKKLQMQLLGTDFLWFDTNGFDSILDICKYVQQTIRRS